MIKRKSKLPDFDKMTLEEEARWWDTHNITAFEDDTKEVKIIFDLDKPRDETPVVRLQKELKDQLEKIARRKVLNISTLARMWLIEKLQSSS